MLSLRRVEISTVKQRVDAPKAACEVAVAVAVVMASTTRPAAKKEDLDSVALM